MTYSGVFLSTDEGTSYTRINRGIGLPVRAMAIADTTVFAGVSDMDGDDIPWFVPGGLYRYQHWNSTWVECSNGLTATNVSALVPSGKNIFAAIADISRGGLFFSTDHGNTWSKDTTVSAVNFPSLIGVSGNNLFAWNEKGLWRRPLSDLIASVGGISHAVIQQWNLDQNYPNPFNPTTRISYTISSTSRVQIKVFDQLGREIQTMVDEVQYPGSYVASFNGRGLSSGVYFCRIQAGSFAQTKKMILAK